MLSGFDFAAEIAAPLLECCGQRGFRLLLRIVRRGREVVAIRAEKLFALRGDFGDELLQRVGLRRNVLIGLLGRGQESRGRFFRLLADFAQCFGGAGELFSVRGALDAALVGKMRREVASYFFELRREALGQFFLEGARGSVVCFAAASLRLLLNFLYCGREFVMERIPRFRYFFLPLLGAGGAFGSDGLRGSLSRRSRDLLAGFGEQACDMAGEL